MPREGAQREKTRGAMGRQAPQRHCRWHVCSGCRRLRDPAMRPPRSVTASAQALDHSLPGRPESSFPPLGLLFPTRTASLGSCGGPESGAYAAPVCRGGACPRPRATTRAAPTVRVEDSWRGPMRAEGELPHRGKRGRPGVSAPALGQPAELSRRGGCPHPPDGYRRF